MGKKGKGYRPPRQASKSKANKPSSGSGRTGPGFNQSILLDDDYDEPVRTFRGFAGTGNQSASHPALHDASIRLRYQRIEFVAAGTMEPIDMLPKQPEDPVTSEPQEPVVRLKDDLGQLSLQNPEQTQTNTSIAPESNGSGKALTGDLPFVVDTLGDSKLAHMYGTTRGAPTVREPSPSPSASSEEVVLFNGRNKSAAASRQASSMHRSADPSPSPQPLRDLTEFSGDDLIAMPKLHAPGEKTDGRGGLAVRLATGTEVLEPWTPAPEGAWWRRSKASTLRDLEASAEDSAKSTSSQWRRVPIITQDEGAGEANINELRAAFKARLRDRKQAKKVTGFEPAPTDKSAVTQIGTKSKKRKKRGRKRDGHRMQVEGTDESGSEAAYRDYMENIADQLAAEEGAPHNGEQRNSEHDANQSVETTESDDEGDQAELKSDDDEFDASNLDSSELERALEESEQQLWDEREDLHWRRVDGMSDERFARLLQKQIDLGIDGDELLIDDGEFEMDEGVGDVDAARAGLDNLGAFSLGRKPRAPRVSRRQQSASFPDASMLADTVEQYGSAGFDIMDFDRPSLRSRKKGKKSGAPPELEGLSDEELRDNVLQSWENDREKKRQKKVEREELRALGWIGPGAREGKADLAHKYQLGMTDKQIHEELRVFLLDGAQQSRPFPPMAKTDRRILHELAQTLGLKSKSVGAGHNRYPILYKTRATVQYSETIFQGAIRKSFFKNMTNRGKANKWASSGKGSSGWGSGWGTGDATVRDGEVVGAGAAEIGKENVGHRLMEKMGWTKGQALGKDGDGILEPVEQRVRIGKAGLG